MSLEPQVHITVCRGATRPELSLLPSAAITDDSSSQSLSHQASGLHRILGHQHEVLYARDVHVHSKTETLTSPLLDRVSKP